MTIDDKKLIEEAMSGNPVAQTSLGAKYYYGNGVEKNTEKAAEFFKMAVGSGFAEAQYFLGLCFANGEGVKQDFDIAINLLNASSLLGNRKAREQLVVVEERKKKKTVREQSIAGLKQQRDSAHKERAKDTDNTEEGTWKANDRRKNSVPTKSAEPIKRDKLHVHDYIEKRKQEKASKENAAKEKLSDDSMPQLAKDKLAEKIDDSSPRAVNKQLKRNDAIKSFPWSNRGNKLCDLDLHHVEQLMDKELYGLNTAKRQILRFLAVCKRNPTAPLRPLLIMGPPGTGKSSFGKVIAESLNKPLKTISMPSLTAGWQFTGTEKFWENAGCGIIVQSIIDAGEYPVFLFDEVDKAGSISGRHSSPQHGLLNLLDDSRAEFRDEFFEVPVNLENAFFILTANEKEYVDKFVFDRCKVINVEGYKDIEDRRIILKKFVLPKLYKTYNLTAGDYRLPDGAIEMILSKSIDDNGSIRIIQMQAESVLQEAVLRIESSQCRADQSGVLTMENVEEVLSEIVSANQKEQEKRTIGFSIECDM